MHSKRMSLMANPRTVLSSQLISALLWLCAALVTGIFAWILIDILRLGLAHLSLDFLLSEPTRAGRSGGIAPIIVSTLWVLAIALTVALPLGLGSALWLHSFTAGGGRLSRTVRVLLDILAGVPSIVFGLFGAACFCIWMGMGFSILSGGLTLACMILPLLIRTTEMGLAAVPADWQRGALALGLSRTAALRCVLLPVAMPAILAGLMLSIGRILAETAVLLFTSGYVDRYPESMFDSGRVMALHIYDLSMNVTGGDANAYATALVLISVLLLVNGAATLVGTRWLRGSIRI
ncbi:phosphate ABC transporter permease PstA [Paraperlucidibaca sp.]|jgi:phosphate transport system permease protein|uniref:phosphate ABC transporter permease PstA n=1 Tax=Paraperlucidibaca sp. TaxID=2708021 RepID=UPI003988A9E6